MVVRTLDSWFTWGATAALYLLSTFCAHALRADSTGLKVLPLQARKETTLMKTDAISTHERPTIIRQLAQTGKWSGTRGGAHVLMVRFQTANGKESVHYSARIGQTTVSQRVATVAEACDQVNGFVRRRVGCKLDELPPHIPARLTFGNSGYRLPYAEGE